MMVLWLAFLLLISIIMVIALLLIGLDVQAKRK